VVHVFTYNTERYKEAIGKACLDFESTMKMLLMNLANRPKKRRNRRKRKTKKIATKKSMGTSDYPSGIPNMHTIHDPMISVS
jgi:hypothetical protein